MSARQYRKPAPVGLWIQNLTFRDNYSIDWHIDDATGLDYLQVSALVPDAVTGRPHWHKGRREFFDSYHIQENQFVQLAFYLFMQYDEHEVRESFKYDGLQVFGPHQTLDALKAAAELTREFQRDNYGTP